MKTLKVLFLAAEADPLVKVGGLGDVAGSLPQALRALPAEDVRVDAPRCSLITTRFARSCPTLNSCSVFRLSPNPAPTPLKPTALK